MYLPFRRRRTKRWCQRLPFQRKERRKPWLFKRRHERREWRQYIESQVKEIGQRFKKVRKDLGHLNDLLRQK